LSVGLITLVENVLQDLSGNLSCSALLIESTELLVGYNLVGIISVFSKGIILELSVSTLFLVIFYGIHVVFYNLFMKISSFIIIKSCKKNSIVHLDRYIQMAFSFQPTLLAGDQPRGGQGKVEGEIG